MSKDILKRFEETAEAIMALPWIWDSVRFARASWGVAASGVCLAAREHMVFAHGWRGPSSDRERAMWGIVQGVRKRSPLERACARTEWLAQLPQHSDRLLRSPDFYDGGEAFTVEVDGLLLNAQLLALVLHSAPELFCASPWDGEHLILAGEHWVAAVGGKHADACAGLSLDVTLGRPYVPAPVQVQAT